MKAIMAVSDSLLVMHEDKELAHGNPESCRTSACSRPTSESARPLTGLAGPTLRSLGAPVRLAKTAGYEMRSLGFNDEYAEEDLPPAVVHADSDADVAALVWWWDGQSWQGPPESGDYGAFPSQSRSRS
jgi:hypothetical protein